MSTTASSLVFAATRRADELAVLQDHDPVGEADARRGRRG